MAHVVLGVTGGIAAYKAAALCSALTKKGAEVKVIMTENATRFIAPLTFETLSKNPVVYDMFDRRQPWEVEHIALAKWADVFVIAPATANFLAKAACGIADDMLSSTVLATKAKMLAAPAMNTGMYENPATQANMETLKARGWQFIEPETGLLACGDTGKGRMAEPEDICAQVMKLLSPKQDLAGRRIMVTAGPTREALDPVRYITNRSSGKQGYAIAEAALARGARVTLVTGPVSIDAPAGAKVVKVQSTQDMYDACLAAWGECDAAVMAAAPADYRAEQVAEQKLKKQGEAFVLRLAENPDIAAALGRAKTDGQRLVVFAAETERLLEHAAAKLAKKNADLMVANDVTRPGAGFDGSTNVVTLLTPDGAREALPMMEKRELADAILDRLMATWQK